MDVFTDVLQVVGEKARVKGSVTVNGTALVVTDSGERHGVVYTTIRGRVRVDQPPEGAIARHDRTFRPSWTTGSANQVSLPATKPADIPEKASRKFSRKKKQKAAATEGLKVVAAE